MKKQSPMKMREAKSDSRASVDKKAAPKGVSKPSAMERYAQERTKRTHMAATPSMVTHISDLHDPNTDLHHLKHASEIAMNPGRLRAAKMIAAKQMKALAKIAK